MTSNNSLNGYIEENDDENAAADLAEKMFYPKCRFCGYQSMPIKQYISQEAADEAATMSCTCLKGFEYRRAKEREQQREKDIRKLNAEINNVASYCMDRNVELPDRMIALLNDCGIAVLDDQVGSANIALYSVKIKMSKNSKGALVVSVSYSDGARVEI
jgi:hypothetical protein